MSDKICCAVCGTDLGHIDDPCPICLPNFPNPAPKKYKANFLWPHLPDSIEQAGYEFANALTEEYRSMCWDILIKRIREKDD